MTPEELDRAIQAATRPRRTVPIVLDGDAREQVEALEDELERLDNPDPTDRRLASRPPVTRAPEIAEELAQLRGSVSTLHVVVEGMAGTPYRALVAAHPPRVDTDGRRLPADVAGVNEETVRAPLVRACVIGHRAQPTADSPVLPLEPAKVDWLLGFVTDRQMDALVAACWAVCRGDDAVPLPRRRSPTRTSGDG